MTTVRPMFPDHQYLITRRVTQRMLLLVPDPVIFQVFAYCVAWAALKTDVLVHCVCVMSNHYHAHVTDPDTRLPEFLAELNRMTAKCVNAYRGRRENLWATEQPSVVDLTSDEDVLDKALYILCNPVEAGLVPRGDLWPGLRTRPEALLEAPLEVERPEVHFRADGKMPARLKLQLHRPAVYMHLSDQEWVDYLRKEVEAREGELRKKMRRAGKRFRGAAAVKRQNPWATALTAEPRHELKPRVAARNRWRRVEILRRLRDFVDAYRKARLAWKDKEPGVVFPAGTYGLRRLANVPCEPFG